MDSARKELNLSTRILQFDNHFDEAVLVDRNEKRKLFPDFNKKFKNIHYNKNDESGERSSAEKYMSTLRRLNDININPISKKKLKLNNHSDRNVFGCYKLLNESNISTYNQNLHNRNNIEVQEIENLEKQTKQQMVRNFKPCISKVIEEIKRILYKFTVQINHLDLKHLSNEVLNQGDAEDMVFIIGCIISKLKEELLDQENILTKSYRQQTLKYNSKSCTYRSVGTNTNNSKSCTYRSVSTNTNNLRLQSKSSLHEKSLDNIIEVDNDMNSYIPVEIKPQKDKRNLSVRNSSTTTAVVEINKIDSGNKQNLDAVFSKLNEINVTRISIKKTCNVSKSLHDNNLEITKTNWKHPTEIETDKDLLENRPTSMEIQSVESDYDNDEISIRGRINLLPKKENNLLTRLDKNSIIRENGNKYHDKLKTSILNECFCDSQNTITATKTKTLNRYSSEETILIPYNKKRPFSKENLNIDNASDNNQGDEALSKHSSVSSKSSIYMVPIFSKDLKDTNVVNINPASIRKYGGIVDEKMFMVCKVELEKLIVAQKTDCLCDYF